MQSMETVHANSRRELNIRYERPKARPREGRVADASTPLARAAKCLKRLKTAMGSYWKKLVWIWVWRHVGLGLATVTAWG
jgi:hypothetical protein